MRTNQEIVMNALLNTHDIYIEIDNRFRVPEVIPFMVFNSNVENIDLYGFDNLKYHQMLTCQYLPIGENKSGEIFTMSVLYDDSDIGKMNEKGFFEKTPYHTNLILKLDKYQVKRALDNFYKKRGMSQYKYEKNVFQTQYKYVTKIMKDILKKYGQ